MDSMAKKSKKSKKARKREASPATKIKFTIGEMADKIIKVKLCNSKTGRIQSDAFVLLEMLVTINEQKRVQEAVYRTLGIPSPNQNRNQALEQVSQNFLMLPQPYIKIIILLRRLSKRKTNGSIPQVKSRLRQLKTKIDSLNRLIQK